MVTFAQAKRLKAVGWNSKTEFYYVGSTLCTFYSGCEYIKVNDFGEINGEPDGSNILKAPSEKELLEFLHDEIYKIKPSNVNGWTVDIDDDIKVGAKDVTECLVMAVEAILNKQ